MERKFKKLGGEVIQDLESYVLEYLAKYPTTSIFVGCDSDDISPTKLHYVITICFYDQTRKDGVHYIISKEFVESKRVWIEKTGDKEEDKKRIRQSKQANIFYKIWGEVERLVEVAEFLDGVLSKTREREKVEALVNRGLGAHQDKLVYVDADINPDPGVPIPEDIKGNPAMVKQYLFDNAHLLGRNKSVSVYDAAKSYLEGLGFVARFKPNAWASTVAADFQVRKYKKKRRGKKGR